MKTTHHTDIGELISIFYARFMELYGDEELASVATSAVINDLLAAEATRAGQRDAA